VPIHTSRVPGRLTALLVAAALLACGFLVARADAATPLDSVAAPSAGQVLLSTDSFQVRATSDTTADMIGQGADAGVGRVRVQLADGTVGTTPVAFWSEVWKWIKAHLGLSSGCTTITTEVTFAIGRFTWTQKVTVTIC